MPFSFRRRAPGRSRRSGGFLGLADLELTPVGTGGTSSLASAQLDEGLTEQRLLAQDRPAYRRIGANLGSEFDLRLGDVARRRQPIFFTLPIETPPRRTSVSWARVTALGEDVAVALRLERGRPAERDPEEQQHGEARQRGADRHQDPAYRGCRFCVSSPCRGWILVRAGRAAGTASG